MNFEPQLYPPDKLEAGKLSYIYQQSRSHPDAIVFRAWTLNHGRELNFDKVPCDDPQMLWAINDLKHQFQISTFYVEISRPNQGSQLEQVDLSRFAQHQ